MLREAASRSLHLRDKAYVDLVLTYASGDLLKATEALTTMLLDYPLGQSGNQSL